MTALECKVEELRARPLVLLCRTPKGQECAMTLQECISTGSMFVHVVRDDLDALLGDTLGGDKGVVNE